MKPRIVQDRPALSLVVLLWVLLVFSSMPAFATVVGSVHDFSTGGTSGFQSTNEDEVCIFCHTPHSGVSQDRAGNRVPLWNRNLNETASFTLYDSDTFDGKASYELDNKPTGMSLLCLSCHDGVSTINGVLNTGPNGPIDMPASQDQIGDLVYPSYRDINIGTDLSNDHPVSFEYTPALVTADTATRGGVVGLNAPGSITLPLFNNRLECTTCHEPHEDGLLTGTAPFLRMSNAGSAMCTECHIK